MRKTLVVSCILSAVAAANAALGREGGYDYTFVAHTGHLLQIEKPQECVAVTMDFLGDCGLA